MTVPPYISENAPLARMTTFGIGGPARWLAQPANRAEVAETFAFARRHNLPVLVIGGGSNLLVADAGVEAVVVKLAGDAFAAVEVEVGNVLEWKVGAAAPLQELVRATTREGVRGLETLAGIPGVVGGAVAMNSGGSAGGIGTFVKKAEVFDAGTGDFRILRGEDLRFGYRESNIKGRLALSFGMEFHEQADPEELTACLREYRERKRAVQPLQVPSAGCMFRNPPGDSAGSLLELAGVKLRRCGGAQVSGLHANFIINHGHAGSGDVARLAAEMREAVFRNSGVTLEPEVAVWGDDPAFAPMFRPLRHDDNKGGVK